jgi:hypothetical protein
MNGRRLIEALLAIYVATLSLPALDLLGWVAVAAAPLSTIIATAIIIAVGIAIAASRITDLPARAASVQAVMLTILPPLTFLPITVFVNAAGPASWLANVGLLAVVPGVFVPVAGAVIRDRRLRERATEQVVVTVGDDNNILTGENSSLNTVINTWRRRFAAVATIGAAISVVVGLATLIDSGGSNTVLVTWLTGLSSLSMLYTGDNAELAVTDVGLRVDSSVRPWADLDGYRVTDDEIEIERARWWLPSRDFDREQIDDESAFIDGLNEHLPQTDTETTPAATTASR